MNSSVMPEVPLARRMRAALAAHADPAIAVPMAAYMKGRFHFFGVKTPQRAALLRPLLRGAKIDEAMLLATVDALWDMPERECQYAAVDLLIRHGKELPASALPRLKRFVECKPWWDTVDALASRVIGPLVARNPRLTADMDAWNMADDFWLVRVSLLYQLGYKQATDWPRLSRHCVAQAGNPEFFVRKAIGWALRQYARSDPAAVRAFLEAEKQRLSPLSLREAGKHL